MVELHRRTYVTSVNKIFTGLTGTSQNVQVFKVVGQVEMLDLWGAVTEALGSTHSAAHFNLYDGTNTNNLTLNTGLTMGSAGVGYVTLRCRQASAALRGVSHLNASAQEYDSTGAYTGQFAIIGQGGSNDTFIRFAFTSNNPAVGAMKFYIKWVPATPGSYIAVA